MNRKRFTEFRDGAVVSFLAHLLVQAIVAHAPNVAHFLGHVFAGVAFEVAHYLLS